MFIYSLIYSFTYQAQKSLKGTYEIGKRIYKSISNQPMEAEMEIPKIPTSDTPNEEPKLIDQYIDPKDSTTNIDSTNQNDIKNDINVDGNANGKQQKLIDIKGKHIKASMVSMKSPSIEKDTQTKYNIPFFKSTHTKEIEKEDGIWKISGNSAKFTLVPSEPNNMTHIIIGPEEKICSPKNFHVTINDGVSNLYHLNLGEPQVISLKTPQQVKNLQIDIIDNWGDEDNTCISNIEFVTNEE